MKQPYKSRLNKREFLNLPGHHDNAYIVAYVENTTEREPEKNYDGEPKSIHPRMILEIADCIKQINLEFDIYNAGARQNSFHKVDTLIETLESFREAMAEESTLYKQREREEREKKEKEEKEGANKKAPKKKA